jgi:hypothetical protein
MNNLKISTDGIPHYTNCPQCWGFGFFGPHENIVTLQNALEHKEGLVTMESGHEALKACDVCGSTIEGMPEVTV